MQSLKYSTWLFFSLRFRGNFSDTSEHRSILIPHNSQSPHKWLLFVVHMYDAKKIPCNYFQAAFVELRFFSYTLWTAIWMQNWSFTGSPRLSLPPFALHIQSLVLIETNWFSIRGRIRKSIRFFVVLLFVMDDFSESLLSSRRIFSSFLINWTNSHATLLDDFFSSSSLYSFENSGGLNIN
jgi:hypothetical protein